MLNLIKAIIQVHYVADIYKFKRIIVISPFGKAIASSDSSVVNTDFSSRQAFIKGKEKGDQIIGFFFDNDGEYCIRASDHIYDQNGRLLAIIVIDLNAEDFLQLANDYTGLGRSGETNLAMREGEKGVYITPLKFDRNAALKRSFSLKEDAIVMNLALRKIEGLQKEALDYLGGSVIAYTRNINETDCERSNKLLTMAFEKATQMGDLIDQTLNSLQQEKSEKEMLDIQKIIDDVIQTINPPLNINILVQKNIPPVYYHKVSLIQVFQNLVGNAVKYMDKENGEIKVSCQREAKYYIFNVSDNGRGIKAESLDNIFEMFEKAHNDQSIDSSGIGLAIVKRIIQENGGKISVISSEGIGSTFSFSIPLN